jgi:hypothetical protein
MCFLVSEYNVAHNYLPDKQFKNSYLKELPD